jgi:hypothetical protein
MDYLTNRFSIFISVLLILGSILWSPNFFQEQQRALIAPVPQMQYFHFGFNEVIADSLWIRAIQDFDYCEKQLAGNLCKGNGWLFKMLDTVTDLSPHFRMPFATGGIALSVIISDIEGASKLFDKAELVFPYEWAIMYRAAFHSIYEEKNPDKAARRLILSAQHGGGEWFYALAARMYTEAGKKELGERLYQDLKNSDFEHEWVLKRMRDRLDGKLDRK